MPNKKLTLQTILLLSIFAFTTFLASAPASAQTPTVLHSFNGAGGVDGYNPDGTLIADTSGNLYGTTTYGGTYNVVDCCGTVFELSPDGSGGFTYKILYSFNPDNEDGNYPSPTVIFDDDGNLYGTTSAGGTVKQGTVFELSPQSGGTWKETILYNFIRNGGDGQEPMAGLTMDPKGNLFGTTFLSSTGCECGTVFELTAKGSGLFAFKTIYTFTGYPDDGAAPDSVLTFRDGKLFGVTAFGGAYGFYDGAVFELSPNASGGSTESLIHSFGSSYSDSTPSIAAVVFDSSGNLYGTTYYGGVDGIGSVYKLSPSSGGSWSDTLLFSFDGSNGDGPDYGALIFDAKGNLYGTTQVGGANGNGTVYELTPAGGAWSQTFLASFDSTDGNFSYGGVVFGPGGNLYGTTEYGGANDAGVIYQIKP
jgi:uncharacterized repeat protein (TIGR03803 family)